MHLAAGDALAAVRHRAVSWSTKVRTSLYCIWTVTETINHAIWSFIISKGLFLITVTPFMTGCPVLILVSFHVSEKNFFMPQKNFSCSMSNRCCLMLTHTDLGKFLKQFLSHAYHTGHFVKILYLHHSKNKLIFLQDENFHNYVNCSIILIVNGSSYFRDPTSHSAAHCDSLIEEHWSRRLPAI
jgi:hypothetical protein